MIFGFAFVCSGNALHTFFLFVNLELMKHDTQNGWLKPGTAEKKDGGHPSETAFLI